MKKGLVEIVSILDRSGSMSSSVSDVIGSYNTFIEEQKQAPGEALVSLVIFDDKYELIYGGKPINDIPELDNKTYFARGLTALFDAIGKTIDEVGHRLNNTNEQDRPEKVIFWIMTDGLENASKEYTKSLVKEKIEHQQNKYSWDFIFMGANKDAYLEAKSLGIKTDNNFIYDNKGVLTSTGYQGYKGGVGYRGLVGYASSEIISRRNSTKSKE